MQDLPIIQLHAVTPECNYRFPHPIDLTLERGENWIIYGANGGGKTFLANTLRSAYPLKSGKIFYSFHNPHSQRISDNIAYVTFLDQYSSSIDTGASAYQMRWNQGAMDEEFEPRVKDSLNKIFLLPKEMQEELFGIIGISDILDRTVISLSSGEFRRFQIAHIIAKRPSVIILDNPFIGLDTKGRTMVAEFLQRLSAAHSITLILVVSRMPIALNGFSHIINVEQGRIEKYDIPTFLALERNSNTTASSRKCAKSSLPSPVPLHQGHSTDCSIIMEARNISIRYSKRTILKDFSLSIKQGECWALKGENGSGKSTLLSIICADNPQGYACDISLFGRKRGSGESIWDIKKNIGYVSPEMFRSYRRNLPVKTIIASGLHDTTGLFRLPKEEDYLNIKKWMAVFGIKQWAEKSYLNLSSGEQRLVLLCRAFVKSPPLVILDEPFHGLDGNYRLMAKNIITQYCSQKSVTLIMVSHYDEDFPDIIDHTIELKKCL